MASSTPPHLSSACIKRSESFAPPATASLSCPLWHTGRQGAYVAQAHLRWGACFSSTLHLQPDIPPTVRRSVTGNSGTAWTADLHLPLGRPGSDTARRFGYLMMRNFSQNFCDRQIEAKHNARTHHLSGMLTDVVYLFVASCCFNLHQRLLQVDLEVQQKQPATVAVAGCASGDYFFSACTAKSKQMQLLTAVAKPSNERRAGIIHILSG